MSAKWRWRGSGSCAIRCDSRPSPVDLGAEIPTGAFWGTPMPLSGLSAGDGLLVVPAGNTLTAYRLAAYP